jgi:hypothetical protein
MKIDAPATNSPPPSDGITEHEPGWREHASDELIMHLERDQFVAETSRPVARAALSSRTVAALWALRVFVVLVSLMVIYTFVEQLH